MLTAEYDYEMDIEVQREEAFESGNELGKELGIELGKELGIELGERAGIEKINQLYSQLQQLGRTDDILKAIQDNDYRENLFQELKI